MRALLVVNRESRRGRQLGDAVMRELQSLGIDVVDSRGRHRDSDVDCIVAAGGDGTFVRLIASAMRLDVPMGLIPLGTFNELARTLEIPLDVAEACAVIAQAHTRTIDVACVNGAYYVNEASIGISSRIARLQLPSYKQRFGFLAVIATALQAFWHSRPIHVEIEYSGKAERFKTIQLTVANSHRFGGFFNVADADVDDGWLDLYSVEIDSLFEAYSVAGAIIAGKRQNVPGLRTYRSTAFTLRTRHEHRITADGEPAGKTPATFTVVPKALRVFVPPPIATT